MLRDEDQIQKAHDILTAVAIGELPFQMSDEARQAVQIALDTLCWILKHDHSDSFALTLQEITRGAVQLGYELIAAPPDDYNAQVATDAKYYPRLRHLCALNELSLRIEWEEPSNSYELDAIGQRTIVVQGKDTEERFYCKRSGSLQLAYEWLSGKLAEFNRDCGTTYTVDV